VLLDRLVNQVLKVPWVSQVLLDQLDRPVNQVLKVPWVSQVLLGRLVNQVLLDRRVNQVPAALEEMQYQEILI
jgi:hypothetical protein